MRHESPIGRDWERLKALTDPSQRASEFETFLGSLFRSAHFEVTRNPGAGGVRQVDLLATMGDQTYLVEAKWWKRKPGLSEVQSLEDRLRNTPSNILGLFVSYSGFTKGAIGRVEATPQRPILLVTGEELEHAVSWEGDFPRMLRRKRDAMVTHATTIFMSSRGGAAPAERASNLPSNPETLVLNDGTRSRWLRCGGDFGQFVFVRDLFDIDWVSGAGFGVTLDIPVAATDERGLLALLGDLAALGWITSRARWSIQQAADTWHGAGADTFAAVLADWKTRYQGLQDLHHTEEFCYVDGYDDLGFYTLTGQLAAQQARVAWRGSLSFQLNGVPVDPAPLRHLCDRFGVTSNLYFRPRGEKSVARHRIKRNQGVVLDVVGFVLEDDELEDDPAERDWVVGLVAANPFRRTRTGRAGRPRGLAGHGGGLGGDHLFAPFATPAPKSQRDLPAVEPRIRLDL